MTLFLNNDHKVLESTLRTIMAPSSSSINNNTMKQCTISLENRKGSYSSTRRNAYLIAMIIIILGWMMVLNVDEAAALVLRRVTKKNVTNRSDITYSYGGRIGTYDIFLKNVTDNSTVQVKLRKKQMAAQYRSTWCTVPYQNETEIDYRKEICIVDKLSKVFYVLWDGYNVIQVDTSSKVEPSLNSIASFKITIPGNLPEAFSGQLFAIVNEKFAMSCSKQNVSSTLYNYLSSNGQQYLIPNTTTMYYMSATDASNFILSDINYYFRIYNHPSGFGVYVVSEVFGLCIKRFEQYNQIDKLYEIGFAECDVTNEHQRFYWTGTSLVTASVSTKAYTLRFFSMMYGNSIGLVTFNTREASSLSLMLITEDNKKKNPFVTKTDVLNSSSIVEAYYNTRTVLDFDSTLQDDLISAVVPFTYSNASHSSLSIYLVISLFLVIVHLL
ncbi:predicted protein [Naegleria gruberi]|uniref:Predicted protein n=1 Tax=Naegleria gruberi TaxID=5762 RepID=D2V4T3_NAEGR|nr:uncharacterized protein NAEGRDRAFT_63899 [Naegleria gruberi]EFC48156.1 predicted protein [Naegleria gruberi]|eukprot:XP_002680900.1 predicted protein [Naegleria gruberi strain NEG-M]